MKPHCQTLTEELCAGYAIPAHPLFIVGLSSIVCVYQVVTGESSASGSDAGGSKGDLESV